MSLRVLLCGLKIVFRGRSDHTQSFKLLKGCRLTDMFPCCQNAEKIILKSTDPNKFKVRIFMLIVVFVCSNLFGVLPERCSLFWRECRARETNLMKFSNAWPWQNEFSFFKSFCLYFIYARDRPHVIVWFIGESI